MEVVYMGIISTIFNAIFNAILSPIFKFLSSLLEVVLSWLFDAILKPLLINVLQPLFTALLDLVIEILAGIIYSIYAEILQLIDAMQSAFDIFSGLESVTYNGESNSLLYTLFQLPKIQTAIWMLIAVSLALTMIFAIVATLKSMSDINGDTQRPVSRVLSALFRAMVRMFTIPFVSLFAIMMAGQILISLNMAMGGTDSSLARTLFVISSLDACKRSEYNMSSVGTDEDGKELDIGIDDVVRKPYYEGTYSYADKSRVKNDFNLGDFDYMIGFCGAIFLIVVLAIAIIGFITRIFDVLLLILVSPAFVSVMPLDDGEKYKAWQDMFVGKLFSGYGTVLVMELYMLLCPTIVGGDIIFGEGSTEANYVIRLIFLLGGAWAVVKAGPTVTQLLNFQAGGAEADTARTVSGGLKATAAFAGSSVAAVGRKTSQAYTGHKAKQEERKADAKAESNKRINDRLGYETGEDGKRTGRTLQEASGGGAFGGAGAPVAAGGISGAGGGAPGAGGGTLSTVGVQQGGGTPGAPGAGGGTPSEGGGQQPGGTPPEGVTRPEGGTPPEGEGQQSGGTPSEGGAQQPGGAPPEGGVPQEGGAGGTPPEGEGQQSGGTPPEGVTRPEGGTPPEGGAPQAAGAPAEAPEPHREGMGKGQAQRVGSFFGGKLTVNKTEGGHHYLGVDFGKKLQFGRNKDGTFSFKVFGAGVRIGQDGKLDKFSLPFVRWKKFEDGKMHVSKAKLPLGFNLKRAENVTTRADGTKERKMVESKGLYLSDSALGGYKARYDQDTGKVEVHKSFGTHYKKNAQGKYVKTHTQLFGIRTEYEQKSDGSYRKTNVVGSHFQTSYSYDANGKRRVDSITSMKNYDKDAKGNRPNEGNYIYKRES